MIKSLTHFVQTLHAEGVIIYPTESVYGLGCAPFSETAVNRLLAIKQREKSKGLILLASDWQQLTELIQPIDAVRFEQIKSTPNTTWLFPKTDKVPAWIHGDSDKVAVRVTTHPLAKQLCQQFGAPLVSTSANFSGQATTKDFSQLDIKLVQQVDGVIKQDCGELETVTPIKDAITDIQIR